MKIIFERFRMFLNKYRFFFSMLNILIYTLLLAIFLLTERLHFLYYLTWLWEAFFSPPYQILTQQGNYFKKKHGCNNGVFNKSNASECWTASSNNYRTCWKSCVSGTFKKDFNSGKFYATTKWNSSTNIQQCRRREGLVISSPPKNSNNKKSALTTSPGNIAREPIHAEFN